MAAMRAKTDEMDIDGPDTTEPTNALLACLANVSLGNVQMANLSDLPSSLESELDSEVGFSDAMDVDLKVELDVEDPMDIDVDMTAGLDAIDILLIDMALKAESEATDPMDIEYWEESKAVDAMDIDSIPVAPLQSSCWDPRSWARAWQRWALEAGDWGWRK